MVFIVFRMNWKTVAPSLLWWQIPSKNIFPEQDLVSSCLALLRILTTIGSFSWPRCFKKTQPSVFKETILSLAFSYLAQIEQVQTDSSANLLHRCCCYWCCCSCFLLWLNEVTSTLQKSCSDQRCLVPVCWYYFCLLSKFWLKTYLKNLPPLKRSLPISLKNYFPSGAFCILIYWWGNNIWKVRIYFRCCVAIIWYSCASWTLFSFRLFLRASFGKYFALVWKFLAFFTLHSCHIAIFVSAFFLRLFLLYSFRKTFLFFQMFAILSIVACVRHQFIHSQKAINEWYQSIALNFVNRFYKSGTNCVIHFY